MTDFTDTPVRVPARERSVRLWWPHEKGNTGDGMYAELSIYQRPGRPFNAVLYPRVQVTTDAHGTSHEYDPMDNVQVLSRECSRYSTRLREEFITDALIALRERASKEAS